jgi:uncharacterized DUF497 family protein
MQAVLRIELSEFEWDENKRLTNVAKSGIDFPDAAVALLEPHLEIPSSKNKEAGRKPYANLGAGLSW